MIRATDGWTCLDRLRWLAIPGTPVVPRRSSVPLSFLVPVQALGLALVLLTLAGCASSPEPGPETAADRSAAADTAALEGLPLCEREATVTVRVDNKSSFDIRIAFGPYRPAKLAEGFSRTNFQVARYLLRSDLRLEIIRGGLQVGPPAMIQTEPIFCNVATLVIGSRPEYSFFYGDEWDTPKQGTPLPADSAASEGSD